MKDFIKIRAEMEQAEQNFNYADKYHIDAAIYELKAANEKVSALIRDKDRCCESKEKKICKEKFSM